MQNIDPRNLQKLIDGELDRTTICSLLETAEQNPENWRTLAVGFVEDQIFRQEFQELDQRDETKLSEPARTSTHRTENRRPFVANRWLAIAAGILLGLTIGYGVSLMNSPGGVGQQSNIDQPDGLATPGDNSDLLANNAPSVETTVPVVSYRPDYHMNFQTPSGDEMLSSEVPLYNQSKAQEIGYEMNRPIQVSNEMAAWMKRSGYELDQKIDYISGKLDDGREFVIPVRTIRMHAGQ